MKSKRLSIYVGSPDSYSDVLSIFLNGYHRYWSNCPYEFNLSTNTKKYDGIHCFCNNKQGDSWVERTISVLSNITTKYILLLCDDIIICDYINNDEIEEKKPEKMSSKEKMNLMITLENEMKEAAKNLDFERAMELRDILFELKSEK